MAHLVRPRVAALLTPRPWPVVVTGPAGSGKSVAVEDVGADGRAVARLELDPGHDGALLAEGLLAASTEEDRETVEAALRGRPIRGRAAAGPLLVLEGIDQPGSADAGDVIGRLARSGVGLIATARDAAAPLCRRLRFEGRAVVVGPADLAFTPTELAELLAGEQLAATEAGARAVVTRCLGWPVAVDLLVRWAVDTGRLDDDVVERAHEDFLDYLIDQVVGRLADPVRTLLAAATVEQSGIPLTDLVSAGSEFGVGEIEQLDALGLLVPREAPLARRQVHPSVLAATRWWLRRVPALGRSAWQAGVRRRILTNRLDDAVLLAGRSGQDELLVRTLEQVWPSRYPSSVVVLDAIDRLPVDLRHNSASLLVLESLAAALRENDVARMDVALRMAVEIADPGDAEVQVLIAWAALAATQIRGTTRAEVERWAARVVELLGHPEVRTAAIRADVRSNALRGLGYYELTRGDLRAARFHLEGARSAARMAGAPILAAASSAGLALVAGLFGDGSEARAHIQDAQPLLAPDASPMAVPLLALTLAEALGHALRGEFEATLDLVGNAEVRGGAEVLLPILAVVQGTAGLWRGDGLLVSVVEATIARCSHLPLGEFQRRAQSFGLAMALAGARRWPEAEQLARSVEPDRLHLLCSSTIVGGACLDRGDPAAALAAVAGCLEDEAHLAHTRSYPLLIAAVARWYLRDPLAVVPFERAVAIVLTARTVGQFVSLIPPGPAVEALIAAVRGRTGDEAVLAVCVSLAHASATARAARVLPTLSRRERELAARLHSDLPLARIAESMFVSVNTLKTQLSSIYRKLGVNRRADVVRMLSAFGDDSAGHDGPGVVSGVGGRKVPAGAVDGAIDGTDGT